MCVFFPITNSYYTIRLLYIHIAGVAQYTLDYAKCMIKRGKHNTDIGIYLLVYLFILHYWRVPIRHTEQSVNKQHTVQNIEKKLKQNA